VNLHQAVSGVIARVNPMQAITVRRSTGFTQNADFTRTPTYSTTSMLGQVQALTSAELSQVDGLNLQGEKLALYVNGNLAGVSRPDNTGGDLVTLPDGSVWLVLIPLENFNRTAGWTKVAIVRQVS
jgi:hypothetical protein